jgi:hypothetical protein
MKQLAQLEILAFFILFATIAYSFFELVPDSPLLHLDSSQYSAIFAAFIVAVTFSAVRFLIKRNLKLEKFILSIFLASMPMVYLWAALTARNSNGIVLELLGVALFGGLAIVGYFQPPIVLGLGIVAHGVVWDFLHHKRSAYIENWYSLGCLLIDLAFGFLVFTQAHSHNTSKPLPVIQTKLEA